MALQRRNSRFTKAQFALSKLYLLETQIAAT